MEWVGAVPHNTVCALSSQGALTIMLSGPLPYNSKLFPPFFLDRLQRSEPPSNVFQTTIDASEKSLSN